nr:lysosomal Pro-X carboxypeptidase-like [Ipomoea trifida]
MVLRDLNSSRDLKNYLVLRYSVAAQYDAPPKYPVTEVCGGIDGAPKGSHILDRILAGLFASERNQSCYSVPTGTGIWGWTWQASHCLDILGESKTDPDWLTEQRKREVDIIQGWITKYYADLQASPQEVEDK